MIPPEETTVEAEVSEDTTEYHAKRVKELEAANHSSLIEKLRKMLTRLMRNLINYAHGYRFSHHAFHPSHTGQMMSQTL